MSDEETFDPWESNAYGIRVMSPAEDAAWKRFEDAMRAEHGWGWSFVLDLTPTPEELRGREMMRKLGKAFAEQQTAFAVEILTGTEGR